MKLREGLVGMVAASALIVAAGAVEAKTVSVAGLTDPDNPTALTGPFSVGGSWADRGW